MMTTAARPVAQIAYETATCTRCSGAGRMPYAVRGGICFGCGGKGEKMTAAGRRAKARVEEWADAHLTVPASALKPGDQFLDSSGRRHTVVEVRVTLGKGNGRSMTGVEGTDGYSEVWALGVTTILAAGWSMAGAAHRPIRLVWTRESLTEAAALVANLKGAIVTYADSNA